ncbi:MAG: hypothetical protein ABI460_06785 [Caldimonas sp.]
MNRLHPLNSTTVVIHAVITISLAACGGGHESDPPAPLFDADGKPSAAAHQRPAGSPTTQSGLYATPAQYAWEALTAEPYTVLVDLDAASGPAAALAKARADHAWAVDSQGVAHFVRGGSPGQAVAVADGLTASGIGDVFLVANSDAFRASE